MIKNLLLLLLLIASFAIQKVEAQTIILKSQSTLSPIENVTVSCKTRGFFTTSDANGLATLVAIEATDSLEFSHASFYKDIFTLAQLEKMGYKLEMIEKVVNLAPIIVSIAKVPEARNRQPNKVSVISSEEIALQNSQTTADILENSGTVFVQKSQMGGGSPVIRGFEANRILLVVDGVRMNNAIYRSGHLQNAITIDDDFIESMEIVYGPSSVMYGSDALGGVMSFYTKQPKLNKLPNKKYDAAGNAMLRYSSANFEKTGHFDINLGSRKLASLTSISVSDYDDLKTGKWRNPFYEDFGKRPEYVIVNGQGEDEIIKNTNENLQKYTGYKQLDFGQKFLFEPWNNYKIIANIQYSTSSDVPRYDKLTEYDDDQLKFAEWYYGPQKRLFTSLSFEISDTTKTFDFIKAIGAFQRIDEDRYQRKFQSPTLTSRFEDVYVTTFNLDAGKRIKENHRILYGFETTNNLVKSIALEELNSGKIVDYIPAQTRYPDGGSTMQTYALYLTHNWDISPKLILNTGLRYNFVKLHSRFSSKDIIDLPFDEINIKNSALNGSIGLVYSPGKEWHINFIASNGFKSPNVDDYGKVREKGGEVLVPNDKLKPEYAYNLELSVNKNFFDEKIYTSAALFYTYLDQAILRQDFSLNGIDSILYDGDYAKVQTNLNAFEAIIRGFSFETKADINRNLSIDMGINYIFGRNLTTDTARYSTATDIFRNILRTDFDETTPLAHIPPLYGKVGINYKKKRFIGSIYSRFNSWKRIEDYSTSGEDNDSYATIHGTPSWFTINLKTSYQINEYAGIQFGIENILNHHYRTFSSGTSAPGRNFIISLRSKF